jgi:hypothetical protein
MAHVGFDVRMSIGVFGLDTIFWNPGLALLGRLGGPAATAQVFQPDLLAGFGFYGSTRLAGGAGLLFELTAGGLYTMGPVHVGLGLSSGRSYAIVQRLGVGQSWFGYQPAFGTPGVGVDGFAGIELGPVLLAGRVGAGTVSLYQTPMGAVEALGEVYWRAHPAVMFVGRLGYEGGGAVSYGPESTHGPTGGLSLQADLGWVLRAVLDDA